MGTQDRTKVRGVASVRELTSADIGELRSPDRQTLPAMQRFRDSHHAVARLVAMGCRPQEIGIATGYSRTRVYVLTQDPAFQELVRHYRDMVNEKFKEGSDQYMELAMGNMLKAERMLSDKLDRADELDEPLPTRDLIAISRDAADRFGYGKKNLNINLNGDFATALERAAKRSSSVKVIEGTVLGGSHDAPNAANTDPVTVPSQVRRRA